MLDIKLKYQASIFLDAKNIIPTSETVITLVGQLQEYGFIASTFQEISLPAPHPQPRLRLMTQNEEWNIGIASQRIDIEKIPTDTKGSNLGDLNNFCSKALAFFSKIHDKYPKKSNRLGFVTAYLLSDMPDDTLSAIYSKLFNEPPFYKENPPFEWDWKSVSRVEKEIAELKELFNVSAILKRRKGTFQVKDESMSFDRIFLTLDINTLSDNAEYRFDLPQIGAFYDAARETHSKLLDSLLEFIRV